MAREMRCAEALRFTLVTVRLVLLPAVLLQWLLFPLLLVLQLL